jgi:hypothetical protein
MIPAHDVEEAQCIALRMNREMAAMRPSKPAQPLTYEGNSPAKATANQAEFEKRKACGACQYCPMKGRGRKVSYAIFHTQCPTVPHMAGARRRGWRTVATLTDGSRAPARSSEGTGLSVPSPRPGLPPSWLSPRPGRGPRDGFARWQVHTRVSTIAGPSRRRRGDPLRRDKVFPGRL